VKRIEERDQRLDVNNLEVIEKALALCAGIRTALAVYQIKNMTIEQAKPNSPNAIQLMRYFYHLLPEYDNSNRYNRLDEMSSSSQSDQGDILLITLIAFALISLGRPPSLFDKISLPIIFPLVLVVSVITSTCVLVKDLSVNVAHKTLDLSVNSVRRSFYVTTSAGSVVKNTVSAMLTRDSDTKRDNKQKLHRASQINFLIEQIAYLESVLYEDNTNIDKIVSAVNQAVQNIETLIQSSAIRSVNLFLGDDEKAVSGLAHWLTGNSELAYLLRGVAINHCEEEEFQTYNNVFGFMLQIYRNSYDNHTASGFERLPDEIHSTILSYLQLTERMKLSRVSKKWQRCVLYANRLSEEISHYFGLHPEIISSCTNRTVLYQRLTEFRKMMLYYEGSKNYIDLAVYKITNAMLELKSEKTPMNLIWLLYPHVNINQYDLEKFVVSLNHQKINQTIALAILCGNSDFIKMLFTIKSLRITINDENLDHICYSRHNTLIEMFNSKPYKYFIKTPESTIRGRLVRELYFDPVESFFMICAKPNGVNQQALLQAFKKVSESHYQRVHSVLLKHSLTDAYICIDSNTTAFKGCRLKMAIETKAYAIANYLLEKYQYEMTPQIVDLAKKYEVLDLMPRAQQHNSELIDQEIANFTMISPRD